MLAPKYGLKGVAYARVIQNLIILIFSWFFLRKYLPLLPVFPYKWDKKLFREIVGYGINFQIISVARMLYDPITKALLTKFGGLSLVGYYEMANKLIYQIRSLKVSANQILVPAFADLK
ncbi:oligosaccharide flippase family protein [Candidatus Aminicenantes bacterium AC-334-K16]|nr:oligosaccharide flippase family protein [Candidatus Aminicenantes bacterium AC-334-K16]